MENRERDQMNKNTKTSGDNVNRDTSPNIGKSKDDSSNFGQKTGKPEELKEPRNSGGNLPTDNR